MKKTGVFATAEELEAIMQAARKGWVSGDRVMVLSIAEGIRKDQATVDAKKACHALALKHGLPEIHGYYGIAKDGEFTEV